jgi:pimeloyl-ACP methyl ester carboxylesterase
MRAMVCLLAALIMPIQNAQAASMPVEATAASVIGDWHGALSVSRRSIPLVLHVSGVTGHITATFDSPSQGALGLPIATVAQEGATIRFKIATPDASYVATLSADGQTLTGQWSQSGASLPLTMTRMATKVSAAPARPQTPQPPFPYRNEDVAYDNSAGHAHLVGTLTLPSGPGPYPAVLLITGSGLQDRDETVFGHKPFLLWADTLTRRGIAVLRVDDRQIGGSTGEVRTATTADFASDVTAGVAFLRSRRDIDPQRVGLLGHSEGAIIAPMVAAQDQSIAFVVMLAGAGETGETLMLQQKRLIETAMGLPPADVERSSKTMQQLYEAVKNAPDQATADTSLQAAWQTIAGEQGQPSSSVPAQLQVIASPWMRWFVRYDPRPVLAKVGCPVLAVGGAKDLQVEPDRNLAGIKLALHANPDVTVVKLPGLNHLLQTSDTGQVGEYGRIDETIAPNALQIVGDWIVNHSRRG